MKSNVRFIVMPCTLDFDRLQTGRGSLRKVFFFAGRTGEMMFHTAGSVGRSTIIHSRLEENT